MNPLQKRIIEVLTADANKWEKTAEDVEAMLPNIPEPDHEHWKSTAQDTENGLRSIGLFWNS